MLAGYSSCHCHPALIVVCGQAETHPAIPENQNSIHAIDYNLHAIYLVTMLICKYYCKHSIIIECHTTSGSSTRKAYVACDKQRKERRKHSFCKHDNPELFAIYHIMCLHNYVSPVSTYDTDSLSYL